MKYDEEYWLKVYTRDTPSWLALSWQARGLALEIARKLPKQSGELSLGRKGLPALASLLRAPWSEIEEFVQELIDDGKLVYDEERQVISDPQHVERQSAQTSGAERTRRWRAGKAAVTTTHDVTPVTSHGDAVTSHGDQEKRREENRKRERSTRARKPTLTGSPLPEDWSLTPGLLAWAKAKGVAGADAVAAAERFARHWHTSTKDNALKRNWDKAFQTWLDRDIADGKVVAAPSAPVVAYQPPTPEQLEQRAQSRAMVQAALAQLDANKGAA